MTFCFLRPLMIGHGHLADLWSSVDGHKFLVTNTLSAAVIVSFLNDANTNTMFANTNTLFAAVIGSFLNDACHVELHDCSEERHELVIDKKF